MRKKKNPLELNKNLKSLKTAKVENLPEPGGVVDSELGFPQNYRFNIEEYSFLDVYSKTLDIEAARREVDWSKNKLDKEMRKPFMAEQMDLYASHYMAALRLNPKSAAAMFVTDYDKVQELYKDADTDQRVKMVPGMAKFVELGMKATGHFNREEVRDKAQIHVHFNIGSDTQDKELKQVN